jgi:hypothetical protein
MTSRAREWAGRPTASDRCSSKARAASVLSWRCSISIPWAIASVRCSSRNSRSVCAVSGILADCGAVELVGCLAVESWFPCAADMEWASTHGCSVPGTRLESGAGAVLVREPKTVMPWMARLEEPTASPPYALLLAYLATRHTQTAGAAGKGFSTGWVASWCSCRPRDRLRSRAADRGSSVRSWLPRRTLPGRRRNGARCRTCTSVS